MAATIAHLQEPSTFEYLEAAHKFTSVKMEYKKYSNVRGDILIWPLMTVALKTMLIAKSDFPSLNAETQNGKNVLWNYFL